MSLWGLFVIVGSIGIVLALGAAVLQPRDRGSRRNEIESDPSTTTHETRESLVAALQARVDALEGDVDDLTRAVVALREDNEYLQQRIDGNTRGSQSGDYP